MSGSAGLHMAQKWKLKSWGLILRFRIWDPGIQRPGIASLVGQSGANPKTQRGRGTSNAEHGFHEDKSHNKCVTQRIYNTFVCMYFVYFGCVFFVFWDGMNFRSGEAESPRQRPHARDNRFFCTSAHKRRHQSPGCLLRNILLCFGFV